MKMTNTAIKNKELGEKQRHNLEEERENRAKDYAHAKYEEESARQAGFANRVGAVNAAGNFMKGMGALSNDPKWYQAVSGFNDLVGNIMGRRNTSYPLKEMTHSMSGAPLSMYQNQVHTFVYVNTLGGVNLSNSVVNINQCLVRLRADMRSKNSRIGGWEPGDLGQYLIAATELHVLMRIWAKAIAAAYTFDPNQDKIGDLIIATCGFKPAQFRSELQRHVDEYNQLALAINLSVFIPKTFNYYERKVSVASAIYKDSDLAFAQYYHFRPQSFGVYDEANAKVVFTHVTGVGRWDFSNIKAAVNDLLSNLVYSTSLSELVADIVTGYGQDSSAYYQVPLMDKGTTLNIEEVEEPLHQIMNASFVPANFVVGGNNTSGTLAWLTARVGLDLNFSDVLTAQCAVDGGTAPTLQSNVEGLLLPAPGSDDIKQNTDGLIYQGINDSTHLGISFRNVSNGSAVSGNLGFTFQSGGLEVSGNNRPFNFYKNKVTADDVVVATRLRPLYRYVTASSTTGGYAVLNAWACGTEILLYSEVGWTGLNSYKFELVPGNISSAEQFVSDATKMYVSVPLQSNWYPFLTDFTKPIKKYVFAMGNTFTFHTDQIAILHQTAVQGLYTIQTPQVKFFSEVGGLRNGKAYSGDKQSRHKKNKKPKQVAKPDKQSDEKK